MDIHSPITIDIDFRNYKLFFSVKIKVIFIVCSKDSHILKPGARVSIALGIPRIHIDTCCACVDIFPTIHPILSVPYVQFLVTWHERLVGQAAENELWRFMVSSLKTVKVFLIVTTVECFQIFNRRQNGFICGICDDSQQSVFAIFSMSTTPVRRSYHVIAAYCPRFVNEFHCLNTSTLCDVERTILVITRSKANRFCVYLLPVIWNCIGNRDKTLPISQ